jgi:hypothetical protein
VIDFIITQVWEGSKLSSAYLSVKGYPKNHSPDRSKATYTSPPNPPNPLGRHPFNIITEEVLGD